MSKHRKEDRDRGITGEADPAKAKAEYDRIMRIAQQQAEAARQQRDRGDRARGVVWAVVLTALAVAAETAGRWPA